MLLSYTTAAGQTKEVKLEKKPMTIGRSPKADLVIEDEKASRLHCGIRWQDDEFTVKDLASKNGTFVNDERIESHTLQPDDVIRVGNTSFTVKKASATGGATTAFQEMEKQMSGGKGYDTILKEIVGQSGSKPERS